MVELIFRVLGVVQVAFDHHLIYHIHFIKQRVILFLSIFDTQSYPCPCQISLTLYIFCFFHVVHHYQMAWYVKVYYVILFYSVH